MKAILEFDLPEDAHEFAVSVKAMAWLELVSDLDEKLRQDIKHQDFHNINIIDLQTMENCYLTALQHVRDYILDEIVDRGLKLHE